MGLYDLTAKVDGGIYQSRSGTAQISNLCAVPEALNREPNATQR
jgi:hypothetical protein